MIFFEVGSIRASKFSCARLIFHHPAFFKQGFFGFDPELSEVLEDALALLEVLLDALEQPEVSGFMDVELQARIGVDVGELVLLFPPLQSTGFDLQFLFIG